MKQYIFLWMLILSANIQLKAQTTPIPVESKHFEIKSLTSGSTSSMRGLSVVDDQVAWVSGNNGQVGKTLDGGQTWKWVSPVGYEKLDFRDIEAFDDKKAIVVNAGSPAYILLTTDGGLNWEQVYVNTDPLIFLDGMEFWDNQIGLIFGDPIQQKMPLLQTLDGGKTWKSIDSQIPFTFSAGEAGFAASGTSIRMLPDGIVWIASGGMVSNVYKSADYGETWIKHHCPIWQGESSTGVFSLALASPLKAIVVGGNYLKDKDNSNNVLITHDGGKSWIKPRIPVHGYRSAVEYIGGSIWIATGSSGTDYSTDDGNTWISISKLNFNTIRKAKTGNLILMTGPNGMISKLKKLTF